MRKSNIVKLLKEYKHTAKIILANKSNKKICVELFDKNNRVKFVDILTQDWQFISAEVITSDGINKYKQTYADFFLSILESGILIENIKTTNNKQVYFFIKDLIKGRCHFPKMEGRYYLKGQSIMHVTLLPKKKFIIEFDIIGKEKEDVHMVSL